MWAGVWSLTLFGLGSTTDLVGALLVWAWVGDWTWSVPVVLLFSGRGCLDPELVCVGLSLGVGPRRGQVGHLGGPEARRWYVGAPGPLIPA